MLTKGRQNWLESHNLYFARKIYCMASIKISLNSLCRPINLNSLSPRLVYGGMPIFGGRSPNKLTSGEPSCFTCIFINLNWIPPKNRERYIIFPCMQSSLASGSSSVWHQSFQNELASSWISVASGLWIVTSIMTPSQQICHHSLKPASQILQITSNFIEWVGEAD